MLALVSPPVAIAAAIAAVPLADGLAALILLGNPSLHDRVLISWAEPVWIGVTLGLLLRLLARRERPATVPPALRWYAAATACVVVAALATTVLDWRWHLPVLANLLWRSLPWFDQLTGEHVARAGLLLVAGPLWGWLVRRWLRTPGDARRVWIAWLGAALVAALYGTRMWWRGEGNSLPRVESVLDDVNSYGSYLVLTLFVAAALVAVERRRRVRWFALAVAGATVWMLFPSGSRIALLAVGAASAVLVAWVTTARVRIAAAIALIVMVVAGVAAGTLAQRRPLVQLVAQTADARFLASHFRQNRQAIWSASARAFLAHPIVGLGPGGLYTALGEYYRPTDAGWRPPNENAHNAFLQLAAETGLVGVVAFVWVVSSFLWPAFLARGPDAVAGKILAVGALGYLATSLTGHPLQVSRQVMLFWSFLGVLSAAFSPPAREVDRRDREAAATAPAGAGARDRAVSAGRLARHGTWIVLVLLGATLLARPPRASCGVPSGAPGPVSAQFVMGFGQPVTVPTGTWRWMKQGGQIRLCNESPGPLGVEVSFTAASFAQPRRLEVDGLGGPPVWIDIPPRTLTFSLPLTLPPGARSLILVPRPGAWRIGAIKRDGDHRRASILFRDPLVTTR